MSQPWAGRTNQPWGGAGDMPFHGPLPQPATVPQTSEQRITSIALGITISAALLVCCALSVVAALKAYSVSDHRRDVHTPDRRLEEDDFEVRPVHEMHSLLT